MNEEKKKIITDIIKCICESTNNPLIYIRDDYHEAYFNSHSKKESIINPPFGNNVYTDEVHFYYDEINNQLAQKIYLDNGLEFINFKFDLDIIDDIDIIFKDEVLYAYLSISESTSVLLIEVTNASYSLSSIEEFYISKKDIEKIDSYDFFLKQYDENDYYIGSIVPDSVFRYVQLENKVDTIPNCLANYKYNIKIDFNNSLSCIVENIGINKGNIINAELYFLQYACDNKITLNEIKKDIEVETKIISSIPSQYDNCIIEDISFIPTHEIKKIKLKPTQEGKTLTYKLALRQYEEEMIEEDESEDE